MSSSRGSSRPRDQISSLTSAGGFVSTAPPGKLLGIIEAFHLGFFVVVAGKVSSNYVVFCCRKEAVVNLTYLRDCQKSMEYQLLFASSWLGNFPHPLLVCHPGCNWKVEVGMNTFPQTGYS